MNAHNPDIHIMHVLPTLDRGGMELAMCRIIRNLPQMRHSVVCLKGRSSIAGQLDASVPVHFMNASSNELALPLRLRKLFAAHQPTLIHARNWSAWPDAAIAALMARPRVPLVFSFHGFQSNSNIPTRRRIAFRMLAKMTSEVFTVSESARRCLVEQVGLSPRRVGLIPNGIDTARFCPRSRPPRNSTLTIGSVGSLTDVKNHATLIRAFAGLLSLGVNAQLRIAGTGPLRESLQSLIHELGIESHVRLLGGIDGVPTFLRSLDMFVLPSKIEAHPNALLEAMAAAVPCIAFRVGGCAEVIQDGGNGLLVEPDNAQALTAAMFRMADDADLRRRLGNHARTTVEHRYSLSAMIQAYQDLYRRVASGKPNLVSNPRILMLGPVPPPAGGMASVIEGLQQSPLANQFDLHVIHNGRGRSNYLPLRLLGHFSLLAKVGSAIVRRRIRLVHVHTCSGLTFWRDAIHIALARFLRAKTIIHIHGARFDSFAHSLGATARRLLKHALEQASAVVVLSDEWLGKLQPFAPRASWRVVPNGIRIPCRPNAARTASSKFLFLGDLGTRKGCRDLIKATQLAVAGGFTGEVHLVGEESRPGERAQILSEITIGRVDNRVQLLGALYGPAKDAALDSADCFVLPSYAEGLPMALLEAMARGVPAITTRVGAIPEVVRDGQEGFLIEPGDIHGLAQRMLELDRSADLRRQLGHAGRRRVNESFSHKSMIDRLIHLYNQLLEGQKK